MTILNPWSLERLLQESHNERSVVSDIRAKGIHLKTSRNTESKALTNVYAEISMKRVSGNLLSHKHIYSLAQEYGGDRSLRFFLGNRYGQNPDLFFDINISDKGVNGDEYTRTLRLPPGEFTPRPVLREICALLHLNYREDELIFYLPKEQPELLLTPETVKDVYGHLKRTEYHPNITNGSSRSHFGVYQYHVGLAEDEIALHLSIGESSPSCPVASEEIARLDKTLREYHPGLPQLDFSVSRETLRDLEQYDCRG